MANEIVNQDDAAPPAFMRQDAQEAQADMDVKLRPFIHLCQSKSPEVEKDEIADKGDFYVRNIDVNLGDTFNAVILAHQTRWVKWVDGPNGDRVAAWNYPDGQVPPNLIKECQWRTDPNGGDDLPPLANETHTLALVVIKEGKIDGEVGLIYANLDRTATKTAKGILKTLAAENRKGWHPAAVVFQFFSEKQSKGNYVWQAWNARKAAHITDEDTYNTLKNLYAKAQAEKSKAVESAPVEIDAEVKVNALKQTFGAPTSEQEAADAAIDQYATRLTNEEEPPF